MQEQNQDHVADLRANTLVRLVATVASISLVAGGGAVLIDAQSQPRPLFQLPAVALTLALAILSLYTSSLAVVGRRMLALTIWTTCALVIILLPLLQVLPIKYETLLLLDLQDLSPPIWPYSLAFPLLLFLVLELALPNRKVNRTSILFLVLSLLSSAMLLFFASALVGSVANHGLILVPHRLFLSVLAPVGLSALIVLAATLTRKGVAKEGIALLLVVGLGIEWMSTWSYDGPHFLEEASWFSYQNFPMLPILAGTLPGAMAAIAGVLGAWEVFVKGARENQLNPLNGKTV